MYVCVYICVYIYIYTCTTGGARAGSPFELFRGEPGQEALLNCFDASRCELAPQGTIYLSLSLSIYIYRERDI